jgi:hypothetical protein
MFSKRGAMSLAILLACLAGKTDYAAAQEGPGYCNYCKSYISIFCDGGTCHEHHTYNFDGATYLEDLQLHLGDGFPYACSAEHDECSSEFNLDKAAEAVDAAMFEHTPDNFRASLRGITLTIEKDRVQLSAWCKKSQSRVALSVPSTVESGRRLEAILSAPIGEPGVGDVVVLSQNHTVLSLQSGFESTSMNR